MRVVWFAPYPVFEILPVEKLVRNKRSGKARWLVNLAESISENKSIQLHVMTHSSIIKEDIEFQNNGISFHVLKYKFPLINKGFPVYFRWDILTGYRGFLSRAVKMIDTIKPDILHIHGTEGAYALVPQLLKAYPSVVSMQGIISDIFRQKFDVFKLIQKKYEKECLLTGHHFGCRTEWDKSVVLRYNPGANVFYMPEAISPVFFNHTWAGNTGNKILFVGSVIKRKGIEDLLISVALIQKELPGIEVNVIGKVRKGYLKKLRRFARKNNIDDKIHWLGFRNPNEIAHHLENASVFVLPTYSDNSPNSVCEAMAVGVPVIAYRTGGVPSLISHEKDGLLVETGNIGKLAGSLLMLLKNKDMCKVLSHNARSTARERNLPSKASSITIKVYREIITSKQ